MTAYLALGYARRRWRQLRTRHHFIADRRDIVGEQRPFDDWQRRPPRGAAPTGTARTATTATAAPFFLSCIMPAYNEREGISRAVHHVRQAVEHLTAGFEIIVVDDGSTDGTGRILEEMDDETLRVLHFPHNRGYGQALRAGFEAAVHPLIFFTDSDDQFDPMDLGRLLPLVGDADIVVGYRVSRRDGPMRSMLSGGYNMLVRELLGVDVRDVNCAFKLVRRDVLSRLALTSDGYTINAEMLARAHGAGLRVREVPVGHRPRRTGRSKVGFGAIPRSLLQVLILIHTLRRGRAGRVIPQNGRDGDRPGHA